MTARSVNQALFTLYPSWPSDVEKNNVEEERMLAGAPVLKVQLTQLNILHSVWNAKMCLKIGIVPCKPCGSFGEYDG